MIFNFPAALPYIPESIRVHLGPPSANAEVVTVPFVDYIKNVASSELYPSWPEEALRANIYAIISFTLNRIYTEWYPSRGYDFDITNTTQYDQAFVHGRNYFDNISRIVDEIFNVYIREPGQVAPFFAQYCDGIQTTCPGLAQWGTVDLAEQGLTAFEILQYYYGDNIELEETFLIFDVSESYPGSPLRLGSEGFYVRYIQTMLRVIRETYSAIPAIPEENGIFDEYTEAAVRPFQQIFDLTADGIVGKATWYSMNRIFVSLQRLAALDSEGIGFDLLDQQGIGAAVPGQTGFIIEVIQYLLQYIGNFNEYISPVARTGTFDETTEQSVRSFQTFAGLPVTGIVDVATGEAIYNTFIGAFERSREI